jgi:hypothetical protein
MALWPSLSKTDATSCKKQFSCQIIRVIIFGVFACPPQWRHDIPLTCV